MARSSSIGLAVLIYTCAAVAPLAAQIGHRVAGVVTDAVTGQAVAGAQVTVERGGRSQTGAVTGQDGAFDLQVADSKAFIEVRAEGYAVYRHGLRTIEAGASVRLERPATLSGTILNAAGERLSAGSVTTITDHPGNIVVESGRIRDGHFTLNGLLSGPTTVTVRGEGLAAVVQQLDLAAGETRADVAIRMVPGGTIRGRVLTRDGQPVAGARLSVRYGDGGLESDILAGFVQGRPVTGDEGAFYMKNVQPGRLMAIMASSGAARGTAQVQLSSGEERTLDIFVE